MATMAQFENEPWITPSLNNSLQNLAQVDGAEAAQWVTRLGSAQNQIVAAGAVGRGWANNDRAAATQWAQTLPTAQRDAALVNIVGTFDAEPQEAYDLAVMIDGPRARSVAITSALHQAVTLNRDLGRSMIVAADITDARREQLLEHYGL